MRRLSLVTVRGISASLRSLGNFFFPLLLAVVEGDVELVLDLVGVSDAAVSDLLVGGPAGRLPRPSHQQTDPCRCGVFPHPAPRHRLLPR